jgi:hypothetical protein
MRCQRHLVAGGLDQEISDAKGGFEDTDDGCMYRATARKGYVLAWLSVVLLVLIAFASLAVDVGHVEVVKTQLRRAADAAARYAAAGMPFGASTAQAWAIAAAGDNRADGSSVVLDSTNDIEFGTWSSGTFTPLNNPASATAIRITARRTAARSNAVTLTFASVIGQRSCDVHAVSVVQCSSGYGIVGLASISMAGNSSIGYWSATGTNLSGKGSIASNGNITLSGSTSIDGDVRPGAGGTVTLGGSAHVVGVTTPLPAPLSYPNGSAGTYATSALITHGRPEISFSTATARSRFLAATITYTISVRPVTAP